MYKPKFQIFKNDEDQLYYYRVKDRNGLFVMKSEGQSTKQECLSMIANVIDNSAFYVNYVRRDKPLCYSFLLMSPDDRVIGVSECYKTMLDREQAMLGVMRDVPIAFIEDLCFS